MLLQGSNITQLLRECSVRDKRTVIAHLCDFLGLLLLKETTSGEFRVYRASIRLL